MNIGETDADGWTYVRFGTAALAAQDGTHEVQCATQHKYSAWHLLNGDPWINATWSYRIREKARTITVTDLPKPQRVTKYGNQEIDCVVCIQFCDHKTANKARDIIRDAMGQS